MRRGQHQPCSCTTGVYHTVHSNTVGRRWMDIPPPTVALVPSSIMPAPSSASVMSISANARTRPCSVASVNRTYQQQSRRQVHISCSGKTPGGFGGKKDPSSSSSKKQPKLMRYLETPGDAASGFQQSSFDGWFAVPDVNVETSFLSKPIKAVILESGKAICLFKVKDRVFCTDANSTAFQYPLADASIIELRDGRPAVEVTLDGTVYDLETGKVITWCPKNNLLRRVLGSLKDKVEPVDLPVYPTRVENGRTVYVNLSKAV